MSVTTTLNVSVLAGGTVIVGASFQDEDENSVTPNTLNYTVLNEYEEVINSLDEISITPDTSIQVTLSGDDLPEGKPYFLLKGTYDSSAGSDLPLKGYAILSEIKREPGA